jgi:hypothetical protein
MSCRFADSLGAGSGWILSSFLEYRLDEGSVLWNIYGAVFQLQVMSLFFMVGPETEIKGYNKKKEIKKYFENNEVKCVDSYGFE